MSRKTKDVRKKHRNVIGKALSWISKNFDKLDTVFDVLKIISDESEDEVVSFSLSATYTTGSGKTYKMSLPMSKVKDSSDTANTIASIIVASAEDLGATVEEVKKKVISRKDTMDKENKESK